MSSILLPFFSGFNFLNVTKIVILIFLTSLLFTACRKRADQVPYVYVEFDISLSDPNFVDLNAVGGWVYVTGGVRGIIIYRRTQNDFMAYDRNCPYQPEQSCATVSVDASNVKAVDDCCGSIFSIIDGALLQGPSERPLKMYNTTFDGFTLHVQN